MNKQTQEALKMAIEALESNNDCECGRSEYHVSKLIKALNACKEALEQPAQEPVAWIEVIDHHGHKTSKVNLFDKGLQLSDGTNLYTHPHQWQGLTDEEALQIYINDPAIASYNDPHLIKYARAIEQALKEKNAIK